MQRGSEYQGFTINNVPTKDQDLATQNVTFGLSIVVQVATFVVSIVALVTVENIPPLLDIVLTLETIVQGIEAVWYLGTLILWAMRISVPVWSRYIDWFFTTPTMLVSLFVHIIGVGMP